VSPRRHYTLSVYVADVMDLVNALEEQFPVDEWRIGSIPLWPLARHDLVTAAEDDAVAIAGRRPARGRLARLVSRAAADVSGRLSARYRDGANQARLPRTRAALLLGDGFRSRYDGAWFDEFAGPLLPAFEACGLQPLLLEYGATVARPRNGSSRLVQLEFDTLSARAALTARIRPPAAHLPGFDGVQEALRRHSLPSALSRDRLVRRVAALEAISRHLAARMRAIDARVAMTANLGLYSMALHLAATRRRIPSFDLQHGVQGDLHWAYARWKRVPAEGYPLLPRAFWVWRECEAEVIRAWAGTAGAHGVVVGGNRWLEMWREEDTPAVRRYLGQAAEARRRMGAEVHVLVTFTTGWSRDFLELVEAAIAQAPADWGWWIRSRVTMSAPELESLRSRFSGRPNVEYRLASELPLHAVLRTVDLNLTTASSTVIEAEAFGVPSVVTNPVGLAIFPELATRGWVVHADSAPAVAQALRSQLDRRRSLPRLWKPPDRSASAVIDEILALGPLTGTTGAAAAAR
jgi:hypothetical protein